MMCVRSYIVCAYELFCLYILCIVHVFECVSCLYLCVWDQHVCVVGAHISVSVFIYMYLLCDDFTCVFMIV